MNKYSRDAIAASNQTDSDIIIGYSEQMGADATVQVAQFKADLIKAKNEVTKLTKAVQQSKTVITNDFSQLYNNIKTAKDKLVVAENNVKSIEATIKFIEDLQKELFTEESKGK